MKAKMLLILLSLLIVMTAKAEEKDIFGVKTTSDKIVEKTITVNKLSDKVIEINKKQYLIVAISEYLENNERISKYFIEKDKKVIEITITKKRLKHNGISYKRI